ncbi:MAG: hypothetical protein ACI39H_00370 [Lachnospiraceae bacterium]
MIKQICKDCSKQLIKDEIALNKKIIDPKAKEYLCLNCMSESLDCSVEDLQIKIDEFKEQGCTLFI